MGCRCSEAKLGYMNTAVYELMVLGDDGTLLETCDVVSTDETTMTTVHRCRVCGKRWNKKVVDSGGMFTSYVTPG